ncbi:hypothetical protein ACEWY4_004827 [Coilia grayii]|uniref:SUEL-type lectin domain-containing protein n=1 Tax=Coilia grayii TaxID=363190 RepID=A0ABD1KMT0_9TELE
MFHKDLCLVILLAASCPWMTSAESKVVCEHQTMIIDCGQDKVIKIDKGNYGRTDRTTCIAGRPSSEIQNTGCYLSKTVRDMANRCDGRSQCSVLASNSVFSDPCYGTFKYLEVYFRCLPAETKVACEHQTMFIDCGQDKVIKIDKGNYGRTDRTTCIAGRPSSQIENTGCYLSKTVNDMANRCDGRSQCSVLASNSVFSDPCGGTFKYLEVYFRCLPAETKVACEHQTMSINCGKKIIHVLGSNYGRRDQTTCIAGRPISQITNTECFWNVSNYVANRCNGQSECSVLASNSVFSDPCYGTFKYLEVTYQCIPR